MVNKDLHIQCSVLTLQPDHCCARRNENYHETHCHTVLSI